MESLMSVISNIHISTQMLPYLKLTPTSNQGHAFLETLTKLNPKTRQTAVTIDFRHIKTLESPAWFRSIRSSLKQQNMTLIGVYNPQLNLEICKALKIPILCEIESHEPTVQQAKTEVLYVEKPIRSGQQIYAKNQSIVLSKSVSAGAEVAAKNNIYIYGSAHGKIIAGTNGDQTARIFIAKGFPEMISIAGITLISDKIEPITQPSQFYLRDGQLQQELL
jgi:septum site-determining protein MinC